MTHFIYRLLVGLAGCNSEVFVKPLKISATQVELDEETKDVSLTVSGGEWELYSVYSEDIDLLRGDWSYKYYDENGKEIILNPGKTWVEIVENSRASQNVIYHTAEEFQK